MSNNRIFVSGGAGVIGNELVPKLYEQGYTVLVGDLKSKPNDWNPEIMYRQGDLNYITREELELFNPDVFIHLAATFERSTESYNFWEENFHHNIKLSNHLMTLLKDQPSLKRVIFASSYLIYDPKLYSFDAPREKAVRLKETDPILPRNLTGSAKLNHEIELRFLNDFKSNNFSTVCARIFRGYGRGSRCVVSRWVRDCIKENELTVFRKEGIFDFIFAEDTANGLIHLMQNDNISGVINLGNDKARKIGDIIKILKKHFPSLKYREVESNIPYEASQANMDIFFKNTGWIPSIQLEEGIKKIIDFEMNEKEGNQSESVNHNILITSISRKVPLIDAVRKSSKKINNDISIYGADVNSECIGKYFVDSFWNIPYIKDLSPDSIINFCNKNWIQSIIPTRDGELTFFAENKDLFNKKGISVMVSDKETINICIDKLDFFIESNKRGLPAIFTTKNIKNIQSDRFVVKERYGAGSNDLGLSLSFEESKIFAQNLSEPIYQPFIEGDEISCDAYIDLNETIKGLILRKRNVIYEGESHVTTTFTNEKLEEIIKEFLSSFSFYGHVILQIIQNQDGFHIIECNPRFGGASTASINSGLDSFYWFLLESQGVDIFDYPFCVNKDRTIKQITYPQNKVVII